MVSEVSRKLLEKVSASQYALLRSLTDREALDSRWLETAVADLVRDRFRLARGFIKAARVLARSKDAIVRRSALSRAYYGAYHAARATHFAIQRQDENNHIELAKKIDKLLGEQHGVGSSLRELRQQRDEADYSPYPMPIAEAPYDPRKFEGIIKEGIRRSEDLIRLFQKHLSERR